MPNISSTDPGQPSWKIESARTPIGGGQAPAPQWSIPSTWSALDPDVLGAAAVVAAATEPEMAEHYFRANCVLTGTAQGDLTFADWQNATDAELPAILTDYLLIDLEKVNVCGRRLAHYITDSAVCVVMEQWSVISSGIGWGLTWTVDTARYLEFSGLARQSVNKLRLPTEGHA